MRVRGRLLQRPEDGLGQAEFGLHRLPPRRAAPFLPQDPHHGTVSTLKFLPVTRSNTHLEMETYPAIGGPIQLDRGRVGEDAANCCGGRRRLSLKLIVPY